MASEEAARDNPNPNKKRGGARPYVTKVENIRMRKKARYHASQIVPKMIEQYGAHMDDDEKVLAGKALTTAVEIMDIRGDDKNRLSAARLILDFTKTKPVTKVDVEVHTAEKFLDEISDD